MANPQPDKFTRFSNELLDKFLLVSPKIPASCNAVWMAIFRKTYGFNKKKDRISLSQLSEITGIGTPEVCRAIRRLKKELLIIDGNGFRGIQKDYERWPLLAILPVAKQPVAILPDGNVASTSTGNTANNSPLATGNTANLLLAILPDTKDSIKTEEKIKTKEKENIPYTEILSHLNHLTGKAFRPGANHSRKWITARWNEGFRLEDFFYVNQVKAEQWLASDYEQFLRPETLYGNRFESYRQQRRIIRQYSEQKTKALIAAANWLKNGGYAVETVRQTEIDSGIGRLTVDIPETP